MLSIQKVLGFWNMKRMKFIVSGAGLTIPAKKLQLILILKKKYSQ